MSSPSQGSVPVVNLFDAYFNRADLNRDGRISGDEAVAFFRGSNLDTKVLSQIWSYVNQNGTRFLRRIEFYNFLKLVTIAQTKKELTPDIVKTVFYDPASANIPAPQINLPAIPGPQPNPLPQSGFASGVSTVSPQVAAALPLLTQSDIRKYTEIFLKVNKDKDGKITGEEARNLFLSWKVPREVLKQVWDMSDQDRDGMLSLQEFCIALYLMERHMEKRPLPSVLPSHIMYGFPPAVQDGFGHTARGYYYGPQQPPIPGIGPAIFADNSTQPKEHKAKVPVLEKHLVDQLSEGEQKLLNSKFQEATETNKKVEELEKDIKESREKMEFYHAKMQELVLYKSRCDTHLNEMTARALADKHEVELLAKKYEEKYRQTAGDVESRLTIEEARFREIRARVEQVQSSLEKLTKSLNGLRAKPTTLVELPLFFILLFLSLILLCYVSSKDKLPIF